MKISTKQAAITAAGLALATGILAGCSNGATTTSGAGSTSGTTAAKVGLLLPDTLSPRYESADKPYFEAKLKELDPNATVLYANANADASKQLQQAESMITQGVKVLVISSVDGEAAASIVAEAQAKNIPVIAYDRMVDSPKLDYYISFDNEKVGELQGQALVDKLKQEGVQPGDGGILMANGSPTDPNAAQFKAGAHKIIDASGYKVLAEFDTPGWDATKAQDWVAGQITQYKSQIKAVYAAADGLAEGVIASLKAAGTSPLPPVTGQDAQLAGIQRILAGDQYMTVYKAFKPEAERAAELAEMLIKGEKPTGDITVKTPGGAEIQSFLLTPVLVTADKIESTVVADGFYKASDICTPVYAAACATAGVK